MIRFLSIALCCVAVRAATINVSDFAGLSTALLTTAQEGDTVQIAPTSFHITGNIEVNRNISFTIKGSGTNNTTLTSDGFYIWLRTTSTNLFTVSDMTCIGHPNDINGFWLTGGNPPTTATRGRFHFYNIRMPSVYYRGINMGSTDSFGLIDHCYFETAQQDHFTPVSFYGNEYNSWATANPLGTTNACYVEDCYFKTRTNWRGNGFFDAYNGAQVVLRHNVFDGSAANGSHGYDTAVTSARTLEMYSNIFTNIDAGNVLVDSRGGVLLWYDNLISAPGVAIANINPLLKLYRGCDGIVSVVQNYANVPQVISFPANPFNNQQVTTVYQRYTFKNSLTPATGEVLIGANAAASIANFAAAVNLIDTDVRAVSFDGTSCTLSNRMDGTNAFSWPSAQQHGVIGVTKGVNTGVTRFPCYSWNNLINGTNSGFGIGFDTSPCNGHNNVTNLVQSGRDYFQDTDGNWAGQPVGYTALTYPHPLATVSNTPIPPMTNPPVGVSGTVRFSGVVNIRTQ